MSVTLADPDVISRYDEAFSAGADKSYPTLNLVRLGISYFENKPGKLLEYGFGSGANLLHLLERGYTVEGIDVSKVAREKVSAKLEKRPDLAAKANLTLLDPTAVQLPYEDNTFDYLVCISVLSLLSTRPRIEALISEFHRVLKPGAKLVSDINGPESEFAVYAKVLGDDAYEFRGRKGKDSPIVAYCSSSAEEFAALWRPHFEIDDVGFTAHRFLQYAEQEFIVCAHKP